MDTTDRIELSGLEFTAVIGVLPQERERAQPLRMDLVVHVDLTGAGMSDRLADTIDYGTLCDTVVEVATVEQPELLERLAAVVADAVLGFDPRISAVGVSMAKLRPPVPHNLDRAGVTITRRSGGPSAG
ncbi:MAG: dihydroneopterin aldolase [Microthrixaceae bacterium]|nr:dihydroneopterin aldolase [Microthrixaceae bacterium]